MGRKRKQVVVDKPFCYYCGRGFEEEKTLILHQKAKHFKCPECKKKLVSTHALINHMFQVHKTTLKSVPNAKEGRESVELNIFGMSNVPREFIEERRLKEAQGGGATKKQKTEGGAGGAGGGDEDEDSDDEEGKAKKAAGAGAGAGAPPGPNLKQTMAGLPIGYQPLPYVPPSQTAVAPPPFMAPPVGYPGAPPGYPAFPPYGMPPGVPPMGMPGMPGAPPFGFPPGVPGFVPPPAFAVPPVTAPAPVATIPIVAVPSAASMAAGAGAGGLGLALGADFKPLAAKGTLLNMDEKGQPAVFIYNDESESMEERRAKLAKYRFEGGAAASKDLDVKSLQESIAKRLAELQGGTSAKS